MSIFGFNCKWCEQLHPFCLGCWESKEMPWHHHVPGEQTHQPCDNQHTDTSYEAMLAANEQIAKKRALRSQSSTYMPRDPFWAGLLREKPRAAAKS
jgi:hypothetical protein